MTEFIIGQLLIIVALTILLLRSKKDSNEWMNQSGANWSKYLDEREKKEYTEDALRVSLDSKAILEGKYTDAKDRVDELNLSIKEGYGINPVINIKEVNLDFDTYERIMLIEAFELYIEKGGPVERLRSALPLLDKMYKIYSEANEVDAANEIQEQHNKMVGKK